MKKVLFGLVLLICSSLHGQTTFGLPNIPFGTQTFTATSQTGTTINLTGFASATISVVGTALTTATWEIDGANDGVNFFKLPTALITTPGTLASTETTTVSSMYVVNLAGITNVKFITSGTFTATNIKIKLVASANRGLL